MRIIYPYLKWIWSGLIVGAIVTPIVTSLVQEGKPKLSDNVITWFTDPSNLWISLPAFTILVVISLVAKRDHKRAEWKKAFKLIKSTKRLKPQDLYSNYEICKPGETAPPKKRPFYDYYEPRQYTAHHPTVTEAPKNDTELLNAVRQGEHVLLVGPPTRGKTRTAYELIKKLNEYTIVIPKDNTATPTEAMKYLQGRQVVLFLDDLNYQKDSATVNLMDFYDEIAKMAQTVVMVATCRSGSELREVSDLLTHKLKQLYERFTWELTLVDPSQEEKERVAQKSGLQITEKNIKSAPTFGWIVMEDAFEEMYRRFRRLRISAQETLWTLQLLSAAKIFPLTHRRVDQVRTQLFNPHPHSRLEDELRVLTEEDFLKEPSSQDPVVPEDAYLSTETTKVVVSYREERTPQEDFTALRAILIQLEDTEGLEALGISWHNHYNDKKQALICFREASNLDPTNSRYYLIQGFFHAELQQYEEAIKANQQATKYKPDYADAWCVLGLAHAELQQYEEAIKAYKQATKHKPDYADAWYRRGLAHSR
ncbi:MAG: tetratricopeptide repeat protein, partial [Bacteroidota bacterium]